MLFSGMLVLAVVTRVVAVVGAFSSPLPVGNVSAVYDLVDRILPGEKSAFVFTLTSDACATNVEVRVVRACVCCMRAVCMARGKLSMSHQDPEAPLIVDKWCVTPSLLQAAKTFWRLECHAGTAGLSACKLRKLDCTCRRGRRDGIL
jgi:hypothetical protein